jgi:hypothetical protein
MVSLPVRTNGAALQLSDDQQLKAALRNDCILFSLDAFCLDTSVGMGANICPSTRPALITPCDMDKSPVVGSWPLRGKTSDHIETQGGRPSIGSHAHSPSQKRPERYRRQPK